MGDPECQTILPKLKTDFIEIIEACLNKNLKSINIEWHETKSLCIVICSKGYPDEYQNNIEIKNLDTIELKENEYIFHAGTKNLNKKIFSNGGRVLNVVIRSDNFKKDRDQAINIINKIKWKNGFLEKILVIKLLINENNWRKKIKVKDLFTNRQKYKTFKRFS